MFATNAKRYIAGLIDFRAAREHRDRLTKTMPQVVAANHVETLLA